jgi:hypothetical protein
LRGPRSGDGLVRGLIFAGLARALELGDVLRQKVVEHGADGRDHRELGDIIPSRRDRRTHKVGGKSEFEREQNPGRNLIQISRPRISLTDRPLIAASSDMSAWKAPNATTRTAPASIKSAM